VAAQLPEPNLRLRVDGAAALTALVIAAGMVGTVAFAHLADRPDTPISNLYLGSAAAPHPGGGVHGVCGFLAPAPRWASTAGRLVTEARPVGGARPRARGARVGTGRVATLIRRVSPAA
jgi:hypothetical protein